MLIGKGLRGGILAVLSVTICIEAAFPRTAAHAAANGMLFFRGTTVGSTTVQYHLVSQSTGKEGNEVVLPFDFQVSDLYVYCGSAVSTGTQTFTVVKNGIADTTLECAMTSSARACNDTAGSISFTAATDRITLQSVGTAGASAPTCTMTLVIRNGAGNPYDGIVAFGSGGISIPSDGQFCGLGTTTAGGCTASNSNSAAWIAPSAGTLTGLAVRVENTITASNTHTYTVRNATTGNDTDLVATLTGALPGPSITRDTTCTSNCSYSAGDLLVVRFNKSGSQSTGMRRTISVTHDGAGQFFATRNNGYNLASDRYTGWHDGFAQSSASSVAWPMPRAGTLQNLFVHSPTAPTTAFTMKVCTGPSGATPTCTGTRPVCTVAASGTTCSDSSSGDAIAVAAGDLVQLFFDQAGGVSGDVAATVELLPEATATPTPTPTATVTPAPTATVTATLTTTPTAPTLTPTPTATPTATATLTPTPTPTATSVAQGLLFFRGTTAGSTTAQYHLVSQSTVKEGNEIALPFDFQVSDLYVYCGSAVSTGAQTFTVVKNGTADTTLECVITSSARSCSDTAGSISFTAATDRITLQSVATAGASAPTCAMTLVVKDGAGNPYDGVVAFGSSGVSSPSDGQFCGLGTTIAGGCGASAGNSAAWIAPSAGRLTGLAVRVDTTITASNTHTYTVRNETAGTDTDLVATLTGALTGPSITRDATCTSNCSYSAGDLLVVRFNRSGSQGTGMRRTISVTHDGAGQVFATRNNGYNLASDRYTGWHDGFGQSVASGVAWPVPRAGTLRNLFVHNPTAPTTAFSMKVCVGANGATPTCTGVRPACSVTAGDTSCSDTAVGDAIPVGAGDLVQLFFDQAGGVSGDLGTSVEFIPATPLPTTTPTASPTLTRTPTVTETPTVSDTPTASAPATSTVTKTPTKTPTPTATPSTTPSTTPTTQPGTGQPLGGTSIDIRTSLAQGHPYHLSIALESFDLVAPSGSELDDPRLTGALLELRSALGETASIPLRPQAWAQGNPSDHWEFVTPPNEPIASVSMDEPKPVPMLSPGTILLNANTTALTLDEASQGGIEVVFTVGAKRYCAAFGPDAISSDTAGLFVAHDASPPGWCPDDISPVQMLMSPRAAIVPPYSIEGLRVKFGFTSSVSISTFNVDADGDGDLDGESADADEQPHEARYHEPGTFFPTLAAFDTAGRQHYVTDTLYLFNSYEGEQACIAAWNLLKDYLRAGDVETALQFVLVARREAYSSMLNSLTLPLASIDLILTDITLVGTHSNVLEYEMLRDRGPTTYSYVVICKPDVDGVWRIADF